MRRTPSGSLTMSTLPRIVLERYTGCSKACIGTISKALPFDARKVFKNDAAFGGGGASPARVLLPGLDNVVMRGSILRAVGWHLISVHWLDGRHSSASQHQDLGELRRSRGLVHRARVGHRAFSH